MPLDLPDRFPDRFPASIPSDIGPLEVEGGEEFVSFLLHYGNGFWGRAAAWDPEDECLSYPVGNG